MQRLLITSTFAALLFQSCSVNAQLLSCTDIGCPLSGPYSDCTLGGHDIISLGVSNFSTEFSPEPISWTVGYEPRPPFQGNKPSPDTLHFYLGQPPSLDLRDNTTITACALFFDGVAPKLRFNASAAAVGELDSRGSCDDALTGECVIELTQQAMEIARRLKNANFTCQKLADELLVEYPPVCQVVKKSWGTISAKDISGPQMPYPLTLGRCHPTINSSYSVTEIHSVNSTAKDQSITNLTPVLSLMMAEPAPLQLHVDASLSCMKPVFDGNSSNMGFQGGSVHLEMSWKFQLLFAGLLTLCFLL